MNKHKTCMRQNLLAVTCMEKTSLIKRFVFQALCSSLVASTLKESRCLLLTEGILCSVEEGHAVLRCGLIPV